MDQYGGRTPVLGLPFPLDGDPIAESAERTRALITENLLLASILAEGPTRIYEEGNWVLYNAGEGRVRPTLTGSPSARGILDSKYLHTTGPIEWPFVQKGTKAYLYLVAQIGMSLDPSNVTAELSTTLRPENPRFGLMAAINWPSNQDKPILDTLPDGKITAKSLYHLLSKRIDPLGPGLIQTDLTLQGKTEINAKGSTRIIQSDPSTTEPVFELTQRGKGPILRAKRMILADEESPEGIDVLQTIRSLTPTRPLDVIPEIQPDRAIDLNQSKKFYLTTPQTTVLQAPINAIDLDTFVVKVSSSENTTLRLSEYYDRSSIPIKGGSTTILQFLHSADTGRCHTLAVIELPK